MIIDRYVRPENIPVASLSDPILQELDWILEDAELFRLVRRDLGRHYKRSRRGRPPVPVEVTLRLIVLRRRKQWSYRQIEQEVRDSPGYRGWVRVYDQSVPDHTTLNDLERQICAPTQHQINERLMVLAQSRHLTRGDKLRLDASVTETNIRYPTDSGLLVDGVCRLSRWLKCAAPLLSRKWLERGVCRNRLRSARRRARHIRQWSRSTPKQQRHQQVRKATLTHLYGELIQIASTTLDQADQAAEQLSGQKNNLIAEGLVLHFNELRPLIECVIDQATRRVLQGAAVPAQEKVASLWEPHTQIIRRGKPQPHETEFGHKINYAEVEHGLISDWQVIAQGNPPDAEMLPPLLRQHCQRFGHAPRVLAGDRGLFSPDNERLARSLGVEHIAIPQTGVRSPERITYEKQDWFKKGLYFRNGIEGRISVVKRTVQLRRCPTHGPDGFERWIGWGILVANLVIIARTVHKRRHRKRRIVKVQT
jgi:transposase, IS5 family